jgi:D-amino-acid dehydrogenase
MLGTRTFAEVHMTYDVIVVGGGVVGMSIAYHLVRAGASTLLVDRADPGRATDAGAGILTAETNGSASAAWLDFAALAADYYPALIAELQATGAGDAGYAVCGQIAVAVDEDEIEPFERARRWIVTQQQRRGSPAPEDLRDSTAAEARELFPPLAPARRALYYRNAGRVDGRLLGLALRHAAVARGLCVREADVEHLVIADGVASGVVVDGTTLRAGAVAIAGGAWSSHFAAQLNVPIPVMPLRGQIIHLGLPGVDTGDWPLITAFHGHYIVAWPDSRVVVGATQEPEAGFTVQTSAAGVHQVLGEALRVAPGLRGAEIREIRVGLRPFTTADGLPAVGPIPTARNAYLATGHGAYGLHLGPYTGKILADCIAGKADDPRLRLFDVSRFLDT